MDHCLVWKTNILKLKATFCFLQSLEFIRESGVGILFERNPIILRNGMARAVHGGNAARSTMACRSKARRPSLESWPDPPATLA